jgi:hypothetical protein
MVFLNRENTYQGPKKEKLLDNRLLHTVYAVGYRDIFPKRNSKEFHEILFIVEK